MQRSVLAGMAAGLVAAGALNVASAADKWPEAGDFVIRAGFHTVDPKGDNLTLDPDDGTNLQVKSDTAFTFSGTYFFTPMIAAELQAATPFNHDIEIDNVGKVGNTRHIPPTLSLQLHKPFGEFKPYVGLGLNWTIFWGEGTQGALGGSDLSLDDSFGLAAQLGVDYAISESWYLNAEVRWIDIDSDAELDGNSLGEVEIDPYVWALTVGRRF